MIHRLNSIAASRSIEVQRGGKELANIHFGDASDDFLPAPHVGNTQKTCFRSLTTPNQTAQRQHRRCEGNPRSCEPRMIRRWVNVLRKEWQSSSWDSKEEPESCRNPPLIVYR